MRIVKPFVYAACGMVLGIAVTVVASPAPQQSGYRLTETSAGTVNKRPAVFVKDSKTGACWLVVGYGTGEASPAIAAAPAAACLP